MLQDLLFILCSLPVACFVLSIVKLFDLCCENRYGFFVPSNLIEVEWIASETDPLTGAGSDLWPGVLRLRRTSERQSRQPRDATVNVVDAFSPQQRYCHAFNCYSLSFCCGYEKMISRQSMIGNYRWIIGKSSLSDKNRWVNLKKTDTFFWLLNWLTGACSDFFV